MKGEKRDRTMRDWERVKFVDYISVYYKYLKQI